MSESLNRADREPPQTASSQRQLIIQLLREAKSRGKGVPGDVLRRDFQIPQAPARIWELKNEFGFDIETRQNPHTRMATYFLIAEPREGQRSTEKHSRFKADDSKRESDYAQRTREIEAQAAPLFTGGRT